MNCRGVMGVGNNAFFAREPHHHQLSGAKASRWSQA